MTEEPHLLTRLDGDVLIATLNRPDKLNAMTNQMFELLEAAIRALLK